MTGYQLFPIPGNSRAAIGVNFAQSDLLLCTAIAIFDLGMSHACAAAENAGD